MTTHVHDPAVEERDPGRGGTTASGSPDAPFRRPGWLVPALAIGLLGIGLVVAGVVSLSTALYAAAFGGMLLMHLGGHGHGGHGHGAHGGRQPNDLSRGSGDSHHERTGSGDELDDRAANQPHPNESQDDQHSSHGCH
jgi:hypothetical protein